MKRRILLLGSGLVTGPLVDYLLNSGQVELTIATLEPDKARTMLKGHPEGSVKYLDAANEKDLDREVSRHDCVISLLPAPMHPAVARMCLKSKKHLVTASYVSPVMRSFDTDAKKAGLLFLNELGLDPGIDHMSAMRIIHHVQNTGGTVTGFRSYCGGLPAPEANTNPLGYKFSWAPRGVFTASTNNARYLWNDQTVEIDGKNLFHSYENIAVGDVVFEAYPNRDSIPYRSTYGLEHARTMFRGTLRYPGWCHTLRVLVCLGYLDQTPRSFSQKTFGELTLELSGKTSGNPRKAVADKTGLDIADSALQTMDWLGLFSDDPLFREAPTILDQFALKCLGKMRYEEKERDMVVLHHIFEACCDNKTKTITSTLIDYGIPDGYSAMARTVSLPVAIAAKLIVENKINMTGVHIPVASDVYQPILKELENMNIRCVEKGL
jgi:saccharopine dehydrogenase (NADP+, L-glutamate forming)